MAEKLRIGELLVKAGLLTEAGLQNALEIQKSQGGRLVEVCIQEGQFDAVRAQEANHTWCDLEGYVVQRNTAAIRDG